MTKSSFLKKIDTFNQYKNVENSGHGFLKTLQKLVDVMIIENISSNLHHVAQSAVTNQFNTIGKMTL